MGHRTSWTLAATLLVLCCPAAWAPAAEVEPGHYAVVEKLLVQFEADGDRKIAAGEWRALRGKVAAAARSVRAAADTARRKQTHMVAMSDGVRLATDVFLPAGEGPWPVVLSRTPYNKAGGSPTGYLRRGYAVVKQDMRGRFASEGENLPFVACGWGEHHDGADTVAWIRKQAWCSGKVATAGGSALGITQNLMAGAAPEGLVCQNIAVAAFSLYHHAAYVGGALRKSQIEGWLKGNRFDPKAIGIYRAHPAYDEFWRALDCSQRVGRMTSPAVHIGGWFDTFAAGTVAAFVERQHKGGRGAKGHQMLVMGPWGHGIPRGGRVGELRFPNHTPPRKYNASAWLDYHVKGTQAWVKDLPPVAYYLMGDTSDANAPGNEWRFADDWPVPHTPTAWYFHAAGALSTGRPPGVAGKGARREYTFDPNRPCPTVGGCNLLLPGGPRNQNRIEKRGDVLTFTTEPLKQPVEITGHPTAKIHVSSSAADTDLSVRLCDVYPGGRSYLMAEGMLRLRYREGFAKPGPLTPGEVAAVEVRLWPTSIVINRGHRIRITVTSSNYPRFDVNPGTGKPHRKGGRLVKQTNRIYCGGAQASHVLLPVVPGKARAVR